MKFIKFMSFLYKKARQFCHFEWRPVPTQNHLLILEWLEGSTLNQNTSRQGTGDCRPLGLSFPWQHTKNLENANTWLIQKRFIQPMVHGMFMGV